MKERNYVYILFEKDDLELPEFIADTLDELSLMCGIKSITLYQAFVRNSLINNLYKIEKVRTDTFDDFDSFNDYAKFCERLMIKENRPESLDLFRAYCYGV